MSKAAKITFAVTCVASVFTVGYVYKLQKEEREALHLGPIRDRERVERKAAKRAAAELNETQRQRELEYELQKALREKYSQAQPVTEVKDN